MIITANEGGELKLEPEGTQTLTLPTNWTASDSLIVEATDKPVAIVVNPGQCVKIPNYALDSTRIKP